MWVAFCTLVFACGGFSSLFVSGGCCLSVCMCRVASVHAARGMMGRHQGRRSLFSVWFHLVRRGTRVPDSLPLEYSWPGARRNPCDLLYLPPSIHRIVSLHLRSLGAGSFCQVCSQYWDSHTHAQMQIEPECVRGPHNKEQMIVIQCMYFILFPVLYWIFKQAEHPWSVPPLHFFPLSSPSDDCDHIALPFLNQISLSPHLKAPTLCRGRLGRCMWVLWKCQNSVCFSFLHCSCTCA